MAGYRRGNIRNIIEVQDFQVLNEIAQKRGAIRFGSTIDPHRRANEYERQNYSGVMFYSPVSNMKIGENYLLRYGGRHNVHRRSGARQMPGYVYAIKGKRYRMARNICQEKIFADFATCLYGQGFCPVKFSTIWYSTR